VDDIEDRNNPRTVNPGYAHLQLAKALISAAESADPGARARSQERADKWARVFANIVQGTVAYGSRKPLAALGALDTIQSLSPMDSIRRLLS